MTDLLNQNGQPITPKDNVKNSILAIEKLFFVFNQTTIPSRLAPGFVAGMDFLQQMHDQLLAQLSPEEIEEMKAKANPKPEGVN